ncbi:hypothetical protein TAMC210_04850 [Thermanaeromonas sp. C210]|nr:hypothetical protein TAMC210_04850 [Thermanaeromonas sp. C210]
MLDALLIVGWVLAMAACYPYPLKAVACIMRCERR